MSPILGLVVLFLSLWLALFVHAVHDEDVRTYIVRVNNRMKPSVYAGVNHWYDSTLQSLENYSAKQYSSKLVHVYQTVFHGFSAKLTPRQAQQLEKRPWVVDVFPDRVYKLHTTRTPYFLDLYSDLNFSVAAPLLKYSDYGSNVIIGFLDSGIKPDHPSFNDTGLVDLPVGRWKGNCTVEGFRCNNKVIGVRIINDDGTDVSHGTHTGSTAAGVAVENVFYSDNASGTAVGVAPKARIAIYKVCNDDGICLGSYVLAGFEKAVEDGVDIISASFGDQAHEDFYKDPVAIGAFGAMARNISVIASAGNVGPNRGTVANVAPWVTTVAAGTIDRRFAANLVISPEVTFNGTSLYRGPPLDPTPLPLAYRGNCTSLDENFSGKIVFCDAAIRHPDVNEPISIDEVVRNAGGAGVVVANMPRVGRDLIAKDFAIPGLVISESDGNMSRALIMNGMMTNATMIFRGVEFVTDQLPAPAVASFSSRGPSSISPFVNKPDVLAPGVNILAAWPEGVEYKLLSGTSMACAHVSGLIALVKAVHNDWSPAMIRSAIMTTAYNIANDGNLILNNEDAHESIAWDMGAGHIYPSDAIDPGLVYDITPQDYVDFLCASNYSDPAIQSITSDTYGRTANCNERMPWDLNYPVISIHSKLLGPNITVTRTVTNVGEDDATYTVNVTNSEWVSLTVNPMRMDFTSKGQQQNYDVTITATGLPGSLIVQTYIVWSDGKRQVVSPVVIFPPYSLS
ncbi:Subtilase family protein [Striga hermonthica]|uniref:Subtilase family protein n=1 Tax=Striga hermonthica TaxID=68872 RepID=A0A9N7R9W5_STRHE|nr:Subtilase family protein [Striga hermonthica]